MKPPKPKATAKASTKAKPKVTAFPAGDMDAKRLLEKYRCPTGFHAVRAQFMGAIASPIQQIQPLQEVKALWGGAFPPLKTMEDVNQLMTVLIMGLWNQLSAHTDAERPFQLMQFRGAATDDMLRNQAKVRCEELEAFRNGFYQRQASIKVSSDIAKACHVIDELIPMYEGMVNIPANPREPQSERDALAKNLDGLTRIIEMEINFIIRAVAKDRAGLAGANPTGPPPTMH